MPRFITKYLYPNFGKLTALDRMLREHIEPTMRMSESERRDAQHLMNSPLSRIMMSDDAKFQWLFYLSPQEQDDLIAEWKGAFQSAFQSGPARAAGAEIARRESPSLFSHLSMNPARLSPREVQEIYQKNLPADSASRGPRPVANVDAAHRIRALSDHSKNLGLFENLQLIKTRYQQKAFDRNKSAVSKLLLSLQTEITKKIDDLHHRPIAGKYLTIAEEIARTYERATVEGAANAEQQQILLAGGVVRVIYDSLQITLATAVPFSELKDREIASKVKTIVRSSVNILNVSAGIVYGLGMKLAQREADFRRLSAQTGLDDYLRETAKELVGQAQEPLVRQVESGTARLHRGAALLQKELDELKNSVRHSHWWIEVWKLDLARLETEFSQSNPNELLSHTRALEKAAEKFTAGSAGHDENFPLHREFLLVQREISNQMREARRRIAPQIDDLKYKLDKFEKMMVQVPPKLAAYQASIDTRMSILSAQTLSIKADFQYNQHQLLVKEIERWKQGSGMKLRSHLEPRPVRAKNAGFPPALKAFIEKELEPQAVKWHNSPKPAVTPELQIVKWHHAH